MGKKRPSALKRLLAERLKGLRLTAPETTEADYDEILVRFRRQARFLNETVTRNKKRAEDHRYTGLVDEPKGRQETVLANSSPTMLLALAYALMRESFAQRFDDVRRSLAMAQLAHRAAQAVAKTTCLSPPSISDLVGESLCHLGNALRLNSDLSGAERALAEAGAYLEEGTRNRDIRADHLSFLASLRYSEAKADEALEIWKREQAIRRLLKEPNKLGVALLNCGFATCWASGDLALASKYIHEGVELVEDDRMAFLGLSHLAEAFARSGDGLHAWKLLCTGDLIAATTELGDGLIRHQRWTKGIAYRAFGELPFAERLLTAVRDEYIDNAEMLRAAFASLDLLAVLAAQKKHSDVIPLAEATHRILISEGLERKALTAFMILHQAAFTEELTEELAVKVANFIVRRQHNREARYE